MTEKLRQDLRNESPEIELPADNDRHGEPGFGQREQEIYCVFILMWYLFSVFISFCFNVVSIFSLRRENAWEVIKFGYLSLVNCFSLLNKGLRSMMEG